MEIDLSEYKYVYSIYGKIMPERVDFSLTNLPQMRTTGYGFDLYIHLSILESQISVQIKSKSEITDYDTLKNAITDIIRIHTDSFGYINGYSYDVEITSLIGENHNPYVIYGVGIKKITEDKENRPYKEVSEFVSLLFGREYMQARIALSDLRRSIKYPVDTGLFCYRSIESIMQYFLEGDSENSVDRKEGWRKMRQSLNISEPYIREVEKYSKPSRHGGQVEISEEQRIDLMKRAWRVVDRFLIYAKNKDHDLDRTVYPEL